MSYENLPRYLYGILVGSQLPLWVFPWVMVVSCIVFLPLSFFIDDTPLWLVKQVSQSFLLVLCHIADHPGEEQGSRSSVGQVARAELPTAARTQRAGGFTSCCLFRGKSLLGSSIITALFPSSGLNTFRSLCHARIGWGRRDLRLLPNSPNLPWGRPLPHCPCCPPPNHVHNWNDFCPLDHVKGQPKAPIRNRLPRHCSDHDSSWPGQLFPAFCYKSIFELPARLPPFDFRDHLWSRDRCHPVHTLWRAFPPPDAILWLRNGTCI